MIFFGSFSPANKELKQTRQRRQQERHKKTKNKKQKQNKKMGGRGRPCVDDKCLISLVFLSQKPWFQFDSAIVRTHFASVMTLNN